MAVSFRDAPLRVRSADIRVNAGQDAQSSLASSCHLCSSASLAVRRLGVA